MLLGGGQETSKNGYLADALHVLNQQPLGDLADEVYRNGNVISST